MAEGSVIQAAQESEHVQDVTNSCPQHSLDRSPSRQAVELLSDECMAEWGDKRNGQYMYYSTSSVPESRATTPEMRQQNENNTLNCVYTSDCYV